MGIMREARSSETFCNKQRPYFSSMMNPRWFYLILLSVLSSSINGQTICDGLRVCRVLKMSAFRYYVQDQTVNAMLTLTGGAGGVASLNNIPITFNIPRFLNITPAVANSQANSGDSTYSSTLWFQSSISGTYVTCTYNGIGQMDNTGNFDPAQANAYEFASCSDGSTGVGSVVTASSVTLRVVSGGSQISPTDPTVIELDIIEPSTPSWLCTTPSKITDYVNIGGNGRLGGIVLAGALNGQVVNITTLCSTLTTDSPLATSVPAIVITNPISASIGSQSSLSAPTLAVSTTPDPSTGSNWSSPLGNLMQTILICVGIVLTLMIVCLAAIFLRRRNRSHSPDLPTHKKYTDNGPYMESDWSIDASRDTMADNRPYEVYGSGQDIDDQYANDGYARGSQDFEFRRPDVSEALMNASLDPSPRNTSNTVNQQPADCTLMNTKAEIALPGFLKMDFLNDLRPDLVIAEGGGGIVYQAELLDLALRQKHGVNRVVVKLVKNPGCWSHEELLDHFRQEVSIMWSLNFHENVIKLIGYSEEPMSIVTRQYSRSLLDLIQGPQMTLFLDTETVFRFTYHISFAMAEIHSLGIAHRDVKAANLLIEIPPFPPNLPADITSPSLDTAYWRIIVCDFGIAKVLGEADVKASKFSDVAGISVRYAAPEVFARMYVNMSSRSRHATKDEKLSAIGAANIAKEASANMTLTKEPVKAEASLEDVAVHEIPPLVTKDAGEEKMADVYAFAMIIWEMITHDTCWKGLKNDEIEWNVRNGHRPPVPTQAEDEEDVSESRKTMTALLLDVMQTSWCQHHSDRLTFDQVNEAMLPMYNQLRQPDWSIYHQRRESGMDMSINARASMYVDANRQHNRMSSNNSAGNRNSMRMNSNAASARNSTYFHVNNRAASMNSNAISQGPHERALTFGGRSQAASQQCQHYGTQNDRNARRSRHVTANSALMSSQVIQ